MVVISICNNCVNWCCGPIFRCESIYAILWSKWSVTLDIPEDMPYDSCNFFLYSSFIRLTKPSREKCYSYGFKESRVCRCNIWNTIVKSKCTASNFREMNSLLQCSASRD